MKRVKATPQPNSPIITDAKSLGEFVRAARTAEGMTIEAAAAIAGIAKQTLSDIEAGQETVSIGIVLRVLADHGLTMFIAENQHAARVVDTVAASIAVKQQDQS